MAANKRMIDIEKEINDFLASGDFKELALSHGAYYDISNKHKICIHDAQIESVLKAVNEKIKEFIDNVDINIFINGNGIYMEFDSFDGKTDYICIGHLIITKYYGFGGKNDNWIVRFDNDYVYHTETRRVLRHYRVEDVKELIALSAKVETANNEE